MNKQKLFVSVILFFCALCFLSPCKVVYAQNFAENYKLSVLCEGKIKNFSLNSQNSKKRSQIFDKILSEKGETGLFQTLEKFDLTDEEKVKYFFPEIADIETKIKSLVEVEGQNAGVFVVKNSCQIRLENPTPPRFLNTQKFYADIFNQMIAGKREFLVKAEIITGRVQNINSKFVQKSFFETDFSSSLAERKNNIKLALSKFDGLTLEPGESFSFNQVTGRRNEESGYAQAKIISGGTFVQGFGGGVCQVSTTIYNACLLAGLEILEVHPHSLPVSYVEPGFDAMVNFSSSDLVVRNNTEGTIVFATSGRNDKCTNQILDLIKHILNLDFVK